MLGIERPGAAGKQIRQADHSHEPLIAAAFHDVEIA